MKRYEFIREHETERVYWDRLNGEYVTTPRGDSDFLSDNDEEIHRDEFIPQPRF